nr:immunoglobulin light chain junction region [Mus musculus]NSM01471.1 immunoglobulin light chain junction region [Mus musculus]
CQQSNSWPHTF